MAARKHIQQCLVRLASTYPKSNKLDIRQDARHLSEMSQNFVSLRTGSQTERSKAGKLRKKLSRHVLLQRQDATTEWQQFHSPSDTRQQ